MNPPQDGYEVLKTRLLHSFKLTRKERAPWILDYWDLGDKKATRMADELMNLLEEDGADLLTREIFLGCLPQPVRTILKEDETSMLHQSAVRADKLHIQEPPTTGLASTINAAEMAVVNIAASTTRKKRSQGGRRQPRSPKTCRFHQKFMTVAWRCQSPCTFEIQGN